MDYTNVRWELQQGYPILKVEIDGREATISAEQKPALSLIGAVFIGAKFDEHIVVIPANSRNNQAEIEVVGAVQDENFWDEVFLPFAKAVRNGSFEPQSFD